MGAFLKSSGKDILFVTVGYTLGGSENMIARIAPRLKKRGYNVKVLAFKSWGPVSERLKEEGIECISLFGKGKFDIRVLWRYFIFLWKFRPDIVIAFLYRAYIPTRIFAFLLGIPNVSSVRDLGEWMNAVQRLLEKMTYSLSFAIYSCSEEVTEFLVRDIGIKKEAVVTIPNGIDVESFSVKIDMEKKFEELGLNSNFKVVGTVSRLYEPTKGIGFLLEAFRIVQDRVDSELLIVGGGKDEEALKEKAERMKIKVLFLGERDDIGEILPLLDVFVLPSFSEGFPVVLLEAMASGLPVVATGVGGIPEAVVNGKTGFIVEPGNVEELAENIVCLLKDGQKRNQFGEAGFRRVKEKFSIEKTVNGIENLWKGDSK